MKKINSIDKKIRKKKSIRAKISGTLTKPRISVFRSNRYIYAQAIDDEQKVTLASANSLDFKKMKKDAETKKTEEAKRVGLKLAEILKSKGVKKAVFDRNYYIYHGRVRSLAEGLREGGLII
jgi:large subunit ribosomal protein L18